MSDSIAFIRLRAKAAVDAAAGQIRLRYVTDVQGQQMVYLTKLNQAVAYIAAYTADPGMAVAGPYISAEATVRGITHLAMAALVIAQNAGWNDVIGPAIEAARIAGKLAIDAASTEATVEAARVAAVDGLDLM